MKRLIFFLIAIGISCTVSAQQMQYFNEVYSTKYEKKYNQHNEEYDAKEVLKDSISGNEVNKDSVSNKKARKDEEAEVVRIDTISTFPGFTDLLGKNVLLPQLEIKGFTNFNSGKRFYGDIKLFTSGFAAKNFSNLSLFFPETSTYGIAMSFNWLPFPDVEFANGERMKWFCLYGNANYLGKNLQGITKNGTTSDTTRFTTDVVHFKVGFQVIPLINFLSFYGDINFLSPVVNKDPLLRFNPMMKSGFSNFIQAGTKFFIAFGEKKKPLNLIADFSFVWMDDVTRTIYQTSDSIAPRLSIGGTAKF